MPVTFVKLYLSKSLSLFFIMLSILLNHLFCFVLLNKLEFAVLGKFLILRKIKLLKLKQKTKQDFLSHVLDWSFGTFKLYLRCDGLYMHLAVFSKIISDHLLIYLLEK